MFNCEWLVDILSKLPKETMITLTPRRSIGRPFYFYIDNDEFDVTGSYRVTVWNSKSTDSKSKLEEVVDTLLKRKTVSSTDFIRRGPTSYDCRVYEGDLSFIESLLKEIDFVYCDVKISYDGS